MTTTLKQLREFITDAGMDILPYKEGTQEKTLAYIYPLLGTSLKVFITLEDDGRLVQIYAYPRSHKLKNISDEAFDQLNQTLNEFNYEIRYGRWSMDDDGDTRVHFSFFIEDTPFTRRQLSRIHFLLADLMIYQAQVLQIEAHINKPVPRLLVGLSGAAIQAAINFPSDIDAILQAINANTLQSKLLYDVIGLAYMEPDDGSDNDLEGDPESVKSAKDDLGSDKSSATNSESASDTKTQEIQPNCKLH